MAEVYDRLGRLDRREQLARRASQPAMPQLDEAPAAGDEDGFAEVLEAVGRVVRRWPGVSVMVAQDGRPGEPVFRVSELDGGVDAAVVGYQAGTPQQELPAAPARPAPPGSGRMAEALGGAARADRAVPHPGPEREAPFRLDRAGEPFAGASPFAAAAEDEPAVPERFGRMAQALGGASRADADRPRPDLRVVPDPPAGRHASPDDADDPAAPGPAGRVPLPDETSEAVARLAQILRANPSLAATWGRESQEG